MELKAVIDGNAGATRALEYISGYEAGLALSKFLESTKLAKERFDLEMGKLREKYGRRPDRTKEAEKDAIGFVCFPDCPKYNEFIDEREKLLSEPTGVDPVRIKGSLLTKRYSFLIDPSNTENICLQAYRYLLTLDQYKDFTLVDE